MKPLVSAIRIMSSVAPCATLEITLGTQIHMNLKRIMGREQHAAEDQDRTMGLATTQNGDSAGQADAVTRTTVPSIQILDQLLEPSDLLD